MTEHSITDLLEELKRGASRAGLELWLRFTERLVRLANVRLRSLPRRAADEEDVVVMAFEAFLSGVASGRFDQLDNRKDLWQVLAMLTDRQAVAILRHELAGKRGGGENRGESVFENQPKADSRLAGLDQCQNPKALDEFTASVRDWLELLEDDEQLMKIALLKFQGQTNREIARELGIGLRGVERKLSLIRKRWEKELAK